MKQHSWFTKLGVVVLIAIFANASPLFAACTKETCGPIGPPLGGCDQVVYNNLFDDTNCSVWTGTTWVTLVTNGGDKYYDIYGRYSASLYQNVGTLPYANVESLWEIEIVNRSAAGSERLEVELVDLTTGSVVETMGTHYASSASNGVYDFNGTSGTHQGRSARIRFRVIPGSSPGDSYFRVKSAYLWSTQF
jgi:hypothetical protein